ncbi:MAG: hypothetical protein IIW27_00830, partial [Clostridia bacterium]|nr:hypothetical protein [Clostridia bacterium]
PYFRVVAHFYPAGDASKTLFKAELSHRFENKEAAEEFLRSCIGGSFTVSKAEKTKPIAKRSTALPRARLQTLAPFRNTACPL